MGEIFSSELNDLLFDDIYEVRLPMLIKGKRADLVARAREATKHIRANWSVVSSGQGLKGRTGNNWWSFHKLPEWFRDDDAPKSGLQISWVGPGISLDDFLDASTLPQELTSAIQKIYLACSAKFASHADSRRILLLDPHGESELSDPNWWKDVWIGLPPPPEIDEIWSGTFDWIDYETKNWIFERFYSTIEVPREISVTP